MVLHTIISEYDVFGSPPDPNERLHCEFSQGRCLEWEQTPDGRRLRRMISTDPADYLDPAWQPGRIVRR